MRERQVRWLVSHEGRPCIGLTLGRSWVNLGLRHEQQLKDTVGWNHRTGLPLWDLGCALLPV